MGDIFFFYNQQFYRKQSMGSEDTFNWDKAKQQVEESTQNITIAISDLLKADFGAIDKIFQCDKLKERLLALLRKMEVQLKVFGKYLSWSSMKFKHKIEKSYKTLFADIKSSTYLILGISGTLALISGIVLGAEYLALITLKELTKKALVVIGVGSLIGVLSTGYSILNTFMKGKQNADKLKKAIELAQKTEKLFNQSKKKLCNI